MLVETTPSMFPTPDGISLFTEPVNFPSSKSTSSSLDTSLYHWNRSTDELKLVLSKCLAPRLSPDGRRILYMTADDRADDRPHLMGVANVDGSDNHTFKVSAESGVMWPAWHGNDGITLSAGPAVPTENDKDRSTDSVVDYRLTQQFTLSTVTTISEKWPESLKPFLKQGSRPTVVKP